MAHDGISQFARSSGGKTNMGFGAMRLSIEGRPSRNRAAATIHEAIDSGLRLIDSADAYHIGAHERGHNETLVGEVLATRGDADQILVATKGGKVRPGDGRWLLDGRPQALRSAAFDSARRLRRDSIGLYQLHAPDPKVPFADSVGALKDLVDEGAIQRAGISNVTMDEIDTAHRILGSNLVSVQNEFSPTTANGIDVFYKCQRLGLEFMAWRPFGDIQKLATPGNPFGDMSIRYGIGLHRLILAWEFSLGMGMLPLAGATRPSTIRESATADQLDLDLSDIDTLSRYAFGNNIKYKEYLGQDEINA